VRVNGHITPVIDPGNAATASVNGSNIDHRGLDRHTPFDLDEVANIWLGTTVAANAPPEPKGGDSRIAEHQGISRSASVTVPTGCRPMDPKQLAYQRYQRRVIRVAVLMERDSLATHIRLSFRLAAVVIVAGDVDFTFGKRLPVGAGDGHQVARVECGDRRLAGGMFS
jgi:hypothetical protein